MTSFASTIFWLLLGSILIPLVASAAKTAYRHPLLVLGHSAWRQVHNSPPQGTQLFSLRLFNLLCYPLVPAVLIDCRERANEKISDLQEKGKEQYNNSASTTEIIEEITEINIYLDQVKKGVLIYKKNELSIETVTQLTIQSVMLLMNLTVSPTVGGLEAVFKPKVDLNQPGQGWLGTNLSATFLLGASILWSFLTCARTHIKVNQEKAASSLSILAKMMLGTRALMAYTTRIFTFVIFFGPFLGLGSCLAHWTGELIPLNTEVLQGLTNRGYYQYWDVKAGKEMKIEPAELYRTKHSNPLYPTPPEYTVYTAISLQAAYFIFWALLLLQSILVAHLKCIFSKEFTAASWTTKVQHVVEAINLAESYVEWDKEGGSPADHIRRWKAALTEIAVTTGLNGFFNLLMLVPMWVTGIKKSVSFLIVIHLLSPPAANVRTRHHTIQPVIGVFPEEEAAYTLLSLLRWALPLAVLLATLLDLLLVWLYMRFAHPWSEILEEKKEENQV